MAAERKAPGRGSVTSRPATEGVPRRAAAGAAAARELDRLIHERVRLGIVSALAAAPVLSFRDLKGLLEVTDGNLSVHARKLEDAGYVSCSKGFDGRTPKSEYRLTAAGRRALAAYLDHMSAVLRAAGTNPKG